MNKSAVLVLCALALAGCESEAPKAANAAAMAKLEAALDTAYAKYDTAKKAAIYALCMAWLTTSLP